MKVRIIKEIPYEECGGYVRIGQVYRVEEILSHGRLLAFDDYANIVVLNDDEYEVVDDE